MTAGESARVEARQSREKAAYWTDRAEKFERGADGEVTTAVVLMELEPEWQSLHDRVWPNRLKANIDHIAVGPGGIFVIDSKNWTGDVRVGADGLRVNGRAQDKVIENAEVAAKAVAEIVWPHRRHVRGAVCFVGERVLSGSVRDVAVCSSTNLPEMLRSRKQVLTPDEVTEITLWLDAQLKDAGSPAPTDGLEEHPAAAVMPAGQPARQRVRRVTAVLVAAVAVLLLGFTALPALFGALSAADATNDVPACAEPAKDRGDADKKRRGAADPQTGTKRGPAGCR